MKLSLAEGLMLIALDDDEGRLLAAADHTINHGLLSSVILELSIIKRLTFQSGKIVVTDSTGTGNKVLDNILKTIGGGGDTVPNTIKKIAPSFPKIQDEVIGLLVQRGILKIESTKLLWIPVSERMDNTNYAYEQEIRDSLRAVVLKGEQPTQSLVILISLINNCRILEEIFTDEDEFIDAVKMVKDMSRMGILNSETQSILDDLKGHFASL